MTSGRPLSTPLTWLTYVSVVGSSAPVVASIVTTAARAAGDRARIHVSASVATFSSLTANLWARWDSTWSIGSLGMENLYQPSPPAARRRIQRKGHAQRFTGGP